MLDIADVDGKTISPSSGALSSISLGLSSVSLKRPFGQRVVEWTILAI
jgi:hypothetical protein|tara:strand:- start:114 stop:257 length:144 start_codon:yes stop_codon:yes gene_type:complete